MYIELKDALGWTETGGDIVEEMVLEAGGGIHIDEGMRCDGPAITKLLNKSTATRL